MTENESNTKNKLKYPKSVFFIIGNEFCERYSFFGMQTALSLYFVDVLYYSENMATVLFHTFAMITFFMPLFGAMIADSWLGKYRTILYLSCIYAIGQLLLAGGSITPLNLPIKELSILGLLLISLGSGGMKPCISAFGGDQFKLPEQEAQLSAFFSVFYLVINVGSLISTFITPILRKDVTCFGQNTCYPLAFSVPSVLMLISIVVFYSGKRMYIIKEPKDNVILNVTKCISHAITHTIKSKEKRQHWMDYADDRYDKQLIEDIKSVLKVLKLFVSLPIFWALFNQLDSRWTFQATRMDREVLGYAIKPDHLQVLNPLLLSLLIPISQCFIYPTLEKYLFINTPLRRLIVGGFIASLSFVLSGIVELHIEPTYAVRPSNGLAQIRIFNTVNCNASLTINEEKFILEGLDMYENLNIVTNGTATLRFNAEYNKCQYMETPTHSYSGTLETQEKRATSWTLTKDGLSLAFDDDIEKSRTGDPSIRALIYTDSSTLPAHIVELHAGKEVHKINVEENLNFTNFIEVNHNTYKVSLDGVLGRDEVSLRNGGVYTIVGYVSGNDRLLRTVTVTQPNSIHVLWLIPQIFVLSFGELLYAITGIELAFTQAPSSMKTLMQGCWFFTLGIGNLIVVVISKAHFFDRQAFEFFLYAALMFINMVIFIFIANSYTYRKTSSNEDSCNNDRPVTG